MKKLVLSLSILFTLSLLLMGATLLHQENSSKAYDDNPPINKVIMAYDDNPPINNVIVAYDDNPPINKSLVAYDDNPPMHNVVAYDDNPPMHLWG